MDTEDIDAGAIAVLASRVAKDETTLANLTSRKEVLRGNVEVACRKCEDLVKPQVLLDLIQKNAPESNDIRLKFIVGVSWKSSACNQLLNYSQWCCVCSGTLQAISPIAALSVKPEITAGFPKVMDSEHLASSPFLGHPSASIFAEMENPEQKKVCALVVQSFENWSVAIGHRSKLKAVGRFEPDS